MYVYTPFSVTDAYDAVVKRECDACSFVNDDVNECMNCNSPLPDPGDA